MRQRIAAAAPALPEPVVAKLLDMEAGELDLLLQYPAAAAAQVRAARWLSCLHVYEGRHVTIGRLELLWLHPDVIASHGVPSVACQCWLGISVLCLATSRLRIC